MGEAKRRKQGDPGWGKSFGQILAEKWNLPEIQSATGWIVAISIVLPKEKPAVFAYEAEEEYCQLFWQKLTGESIGGVDWEANGVASVTTADYPFFSLWIMRPEGFTLFAEKSPSLSLYRLADGQQGQLQLLSIIATVKKAIVGCDHEPA
ncbi:MAG TPA: hypothetical protein V6C46_08105 [Coleofasciculaceae cyanobacterium]